MRRTIVSLVFAFLAAIWASAPAFPQVCCPNGCVQNGADGCWYIGTNNSCPRISCQSQPSRNPGSPSGTGTTRGPVNPSGNYEGYCGLPFPPQSVAKFTKQCAKDLAVNAQRSCLVESDADRAQDAITGLSCSARKAQLVKMPTCSNLCATYAASRTFCDDRDSKWRQAFGAIGGFAYGKANVNLCGTLPSRTEKRLRVPH